MMERNSTFTGDLEAAKAPATSRRGFLWGAAWTWFAGLSAASFGSGLRFFFPKVNYDPATAFKAGRPEDFAEGVDERLKKERGVWIVRENGRLFALAAVCTHLGCAPNWLEGEGKFKCPCHGSGFRRDGMNFEGPAPRPLERAWVGLDYEGRLIVDAGRRFVRDPARGLDEWDRPGAFLEV